MARRVSCTAVVTGANSGVGFETTRRLKASGWRVVMVCRSRERGERAREELSAAVRGGSLDLVLADLASLDAVAHLAERLSADHPRLDALVLNAGLYSPDLRRTEDGLELTMAVNHLAHVLLTIRLGPALERAAGKVVSVSSEGHRRGDLKRVTTLEEVFDGSAWSGGFQAYADSKLANVLFAHELDRRARACGVRADAVHPGVLATRIWDRTRGVASVVSRLWKLLMPGPGPGGEAVSRPLLDSTLRAGGGRYFKGEREAAPAPPATDPELADKLWAESLRAVGLTPGSTWPDG